MKKAWEDNFPGVRSSLHSGLSTSASPQRPLQRLAAYTAYVQVPTFSCTYHLLNGTMTRAKVPRADQDLYNQALRMGLESEVDAVRAELVEGKDASPATAKFFAGRPNS